MKKVEMKFSKTQLESIIRTLLEESHNKKFANNVRSLFRMFEDQKLAFQVEIDVALYLIHKILELSIDYSLSTKEDILSNLNLEGRYKQDAYDVLERLNSMPIDRKIYEMSDKLVSDELQYGLLGNRVNQIQDYMTILQSSAYDDRQEFMKEVVDVFDKFNRDLKEASSSISDQVEDINLSDNTFVNFIGHVITEKRKPSAKIKLGVQYLNEIFNGGLEAGRVYLALGLAKGWKSF